MRSFARAHGGEQQPRRSLLLSTAAVSRLRSCARNSGGAEQSGKAPLARQPLLTDSANKHDAESSRVKHDCTRRPARMVTHSLFLVAALCLCCSRRSVSPAGQPFVRVGVSFPPFARIDCDCGCSCCCSVRVGLAFGTPSAGQLNSHAAEERGECRVKRRDGAERCVRRKRAAGGVV